MEAWPLPPSLPPDSQFSPDIHMSPAIAEICPVLGRPGQGGDHPLSAEMSDGAFIGRSLWGHGLQRLMEMAGGL